MGTFNADTGIVLVCYRPFGGFPLEACLKLFFATAAKRAAAATYYLNLYRLTTAKEAKRKNFG